MKLYHIIFGLGALFLSSCGIRSEQFMNDDAYLVKPNSNPIGESSADETSYSAFKKRKNDSNNTITYSATDNRQNRRCLTQQMWFEGCGCSYWYWAQYSPYSYRYPYQTYYGYGAYGYNPYYGHSSYYNYGYYGGSPWGYNPYYGYSSYYYDPFAPNIPYYYGTNPYYGNQYYSNQNWNNSQSNNGTSIISRPRGSMAGYANPSGRKVGQTVAKSGTVNSGATGKPNKSLSANSSTVTRKPITNSYQTGSRRTETTNTTSRQGDFISNSSKPRVNSTNTSTNSRTNQGSYGNNNNSGRSYEPSNQGSIGRSSAPSNSSNSGGRSGSSGKSGSSNSSSGRRN